MSYSLDQIAAGDVRALARSISLVQRGDTTIAPLLEAVKLLPRRAVRVGITGPPGVGKSSLTRELVRRLRARGDRVAVVASDPVSPLTGGALLGDRYRLAGVTDDEGVFFRSVAHRGATGELPAVLWSAVDLLDAAGFDWVILETVGTGQADVHALRGCDLKLLVHAADAGDALQMMKAGLVETADLHIVGKCDRPGAKAWATELNGILALGGDAAGKVLAASALSGEGVDELVDELWRLRKVKQGT